MRLLLVELNRFWTRRMTVLTLATFALLMVGGTAIGFTQIKGKFDSTPTVDQACVESFGQPDTDGGAFSGPNETEIAEICTEGGDTRFWMTQALVDQKISDWDEYKTETTAIETTEIEGKAVRATRDGLIGPAGSIGALVSIFFGTIVGASFIGAEYKAGTLENLLLWEPRRLRLIFTKIIAAAVSIFVSCLLLNGVFAGLMSFLAATKGTFEGADQQFWFDYLGVIIRASLMGAAFGLLSFAIAMATKHTAAAISAILGWIVIMPIIISLLLKGLTQFEIMSNALSFAVGGDVAKNFEDQMVYSHGFLAAGLIVAAWTLTPLAVSTLIFRRRDVD